MSGAPRPERAPEWLPPPSELEAETLRRALVPPPRELRFVEPSAAPIDGGESTVRRIHDPTLPPGGYELRLRAAPPGRPGRPARVELRQRCPREGDEAVPGTLAQLLSILGGAPRDLVVRDWPEHATRGFLLDVSRGRVPDAGERGALVERLSALGLNRLELYTEHTFQYAGHEQVWRGTGALSPEDVRQLDAQCRRRGIDLVANQNCFGHFENWLCHPRYRSLAETQGSFEFEGITLPGPFSLCPTDPGSLELVRDLLDQLLPCFSGSSVNLNCDVTQDVGQGRSRAAVNERGAFEVYRDYVSAIAEIARSHGKRPQIWADIALRYPARIAELPEDLELIAWGYEPDHPFDHQARQLAASGRPYLLCGGTGTWRSWLGRTTERRANLDALCAAAQGHRPAGVLIAEWGDADTNRPNRSVVSLWPSSRAEPGIPRRRPTRARSRSTCSAMRAAASPIGSRSSETSTSSCAACAASPAPAASGGRCAMPGPCSSACGPRGLPTHSFGSRTPGSRWGSASRIWRRGAPRSARSWTASSSAASTRRAGDWA